MNNVVLTGRIVADPQLRKTQSDVSLVSFTLAVDRPYRQRSSEGQDTDFIDCVAWRNNAEYLANYVKKGNMLVLRGSISVRSYTTQDGTSRKAFEVVVDDVTNLTPRPRDGQSAAQQVAPPDPFADSQDSSGYAPFSNDNTAFKKDPDYDPFKED
ncbi:MAG: single-stranded DNA-binding protein [Abditibacteriota bacterium]|nr:single-stranded DNA-binding protein [Abditibacteriota bacterium]